VVTFEHALKRAIESVFQVEPNEIGVVTLGDPEAANILIYEAAGRWSMMSTMPGRWDFGMGIYHVN